MNKKVRWGVLGYARIAKLSVIPAIIKASNAEFHAVASRDKDKLQQCQAEFGCEKTCMSYEELLNDPDIEAVYIPLPNSMHKEWTIKAAERGKHVLCEKPLALNEREAQEMFEACEKNKVNLMEAFMYRFTDRTKKVTEILESGILGEIKKIHSTFRFLLNRPNTIKMVPELGGGSLYDVGCYPVNFIGLVTKGMPVSMKADCVKKEGVDISFSAILKYDQDIIASIDCGFNSYGRVYSEIIGTKGLLEIPHTFLDDGGAITLITDEGIKEISVESSERYVLEVEHFSDRILHNKKPFLAPDESIRNIRILEGLLKSAFDTGNE